MHSAAPGNGNCQHADGNGNTNAKFLFLILQPPNKAIAVIGATFGGCAISLVVTANTIIDNIVKFL